MALRRAEDAPSREGSKRDGKGIPRKTYKAAPHVAALSHTSTSKSDGPPPDSFLAAQRSPSMNASMRQHEACATQPQKTHTSPTPSPPFPATRTGGAAQGSTTPPHSPRPPAPPRPPRPAAATTTAGRLPTASRSGAAARLAAACHHRPQRPRRPPAHEGTAVQQPRPQHRARLARQHWPQQQQQLLLQQRPLGLPERSCRPPRCVQVSRSRAASWARRRAALQREPLAAGRLVAALAWRRGPDGASRRAARAARRLPTRGGNVSLLVASPSFAKPPSACWRADETLAKRGAYGSPGVHPSPHAPLRCAGWSPVAV